MRTNRVEPLVDIHELAALSDLSVQTVTRLVTAGVLHPARSSAGSRLFTSAIAPRARLAHLMRRLGYTPDQVRDLLDSWQELQNPLPGRGIYEQAQYRFSAWCEHVHQHADSPADRRFAQMLEQLSSHLAETGGLPPIGDVLAREGLWDPPLLRRDPAPD